MEYVDTGRRSAAENMELDSALLQDLEHERQIILHLYDWEEPCGTYGHFIDPAKFLRGDCGLQMAKRPTGGGILFHTTDLAFSVLVPASHPSFSNNTLENYAFINQKVIQVVEEFTHLSAHLLPQEPTPLDEASKNFCMAKPTKYDVMVQRQKVGGAAQRKTRHGYLHQGTIFLKRPTTAFLERVLLEGTRVQEGMASHSFPLLSDDEDLDAARHVLKSLLIKIFQEEL
ncbi:MAG: lipoyl protein ligase domain-containing protein [Chlamydiales bacterium]